MDVVWMDKFLLDKTVANTKGQSVIEYILLLSVIAGLGSAVMNNKKFKGFLSGKDGMFLTMKKGMAYSYRYGIEYNNGMVYDFDYSSPKHPTYMNAEAGSSHFFTNGKKYP
jgi:hypothetical protein